MISNYCVTCTRNFNSSIKSQCLKIININVMDPRTITSKIPLKQVEYLEEFRFLV